MHDSYSLEPSVIADAVGFLWFGPSADDVRKEEAIRALQQENTFRRAEKDWFDLTEKMGEDGSTAFIGINQFILATVTIRRHKIDVAMYARKLYEDSDCWGEVLTQLCREFLGHKNA